MHIRAGQGTRWVDIIPALAVLMLGLAALVAATLLLSAAPGQYVVVTRPGTDRVQVMDMVYRAGGGVTGFGGLSNIALATSDDPGFGDAAHAGGAWLVLPSPRLLGCSATGKGETR